MAGGEGSGFRAIGLPFSILVFLAAFLVAGCSGNSRPACTTQEEEAESSTTRPGTPATRPNIIFILTDDLDGASAQKMPTLCSQMIQKGASFENAFVSFPLCCPSRATILTGLYAHNHDVKSDEPPQGGFQKFYSEGLERDTIAVRLQRSGYKTALFGRYITQYPAGAMTYVPPGWDEWYAKLDANEAYDYRINENGRVVPYGNAAEDFYTDVLSRQAVDFVERAAPEGQPFFMYIAPILPHAPATPAERHNRAFRNGKAPRPPSFDEEDVSDKPSWIRNAEHLSEEEITQIDGSYRRRLRSMLAVDEMVDALLRELRAAGVLDETFIFFTSDNGWLQGEHRIPYGKERPYEESVRVPLFVRGPGVPAGSKVRALALNTDLAPTFAELAGTEFPADGASLAPLLHGEEPASWRTAILLEEYNERTEEAGEEAKSPPALAFTAIRTETHKYVEYDNGERELYDLDADPYELDNIYESGKSSLLDGLKTRLNALRSCAGRGCRQAEEAS